MATETLKLRLAGGEDAASRARAALRAFNGGLAGIADSVRLLTTELVTNTFRHGGASREAVIELEVRTSPRGVRVEVDDGGPGFEPRLREPSHEGGFGLLLVERMADRWGVDRERPSRVWFEVDRPV
jgi:anti-sigma regulatory factor (Ser/Thr protein kinase)